MNGNGNTGTCSKKLADDSTNCTQTPTIGQSFDTHFSMYPEVGPESFERAEVDMSDMTPSYVQWTPNWSMARHLKAAPNAKTYKCACRVIHSTIAKIWNQAHVWNKRQTSLGSRWRTKPIQNFQFLEQCRQKATRRRATSRLQSRRNKSPDCWFRLVCMHSTALPYSKPLTNTVLLVEKVHRSSHLHCFEQENKGPLLHWI